MSENETKFYWVDRIEGEYTVIEKANSKMMNKKLENMPKQIKEGDGLIKINDKWIIDKQEKNRRLSRIQNLLNRMKKKIVNLIFIILI